MTVPSRQRSRSLRVKFLLWFGVSIIAASGAMSWLAHDLIAERVGTEIERRARLLANGVATVAVASNDPAALQKYVNLQAANPEVRDILVVESDPPRVRAASVRAWIGRTPDGISDETLRRRVRRALSGESVAARYLDGDHRNFTLVSRLADLWMSRRPPVSASERFLDLGADTRSSAVGNGIVAVTLDAGPAFAAAADLRRRMVGGAALIILVVGAIGYALFEWLVLTRLARMEAAVGRRKSDRRTALDAEISDDEIGRLGQALDTAFDALEETRRRFKDYSDVASDWVWEMGPDLRFTYVSSRIEEVTGISAEAHIGKRRQDIEHRDEDAEAMRRHWETLVAHRPFRDFAYWRRRADGSECCLSASGKPVFDHDGTFLGYRDTGRDVTRYKQNERALRESELRFRDLIETVGAIPFEADPVSCRFLYVGPQAVGILGYPTEAWLKEGFWAAHIHDDDRATTTADCRAALDRDESDYVLEYRMIAADRRVVWIREIVNVVTDDAGDRHIRGLMFDASERKRAELEARENAARFSSILDNIPVAIYLKDLDGRYLIINRRFEETFGVTNAEVQGRRVDEVFPDDSSTRAHEIDGRVRQGGAVIDEEYDVPRLGRSFVAVKFPIRGPDNRIVAIGGADSDITESRRTESRLRESEERLRTLAANLPGVVYQRRIAADGGVSYPFVSSGALGLYGYEPEEIMADPSIFRGAILEEDRAEFEALIAVSARDRVRFHWVGRVRTRTGRIKWVQVESRPRSAEDGGVLWDGIIVDVSERQRAREVKRGRGKMLEKLTTGAPLEEVLATLVETAEEVNPELMCSVLLVDRDSHTLKMCAGGSLPESYVQGLGAVPIAPDAGSCGAAAFHGRRMIVEDVTTHPNWEPFRDLVKEAGLGACWSEPVMASDGEILGTLAVYDRQSRTPEASDIAFVETAAKLASIAIERRGAEREIYAAKEHAELANRAKSEFLANMSHELRTPLNAVIGFSEVIASQILGPIGNDKYAEYANDIHASGEHLLELINDILDLSKIEAGKLELHEEDVDIERAIRAALTLVKERAEAGGLRLDRIVPKTLPMLRADERKLKQMLLNMLSNAIKFTPKGGRVLLRIGVDRRHGLTFEVSDTGIGIAPEDIPRAMSPFGQVESAMTRTCEGTGLGLPLIRALAEAHGASFTLDSAIGVGTTARVRFPRARVISGAESAA